MVIVSTMMPLAKVKSTQAFGEAPGRAVQSPRHQHQRAMPYACCGRRLSARNRRGTVSDDTQTTLSHPVLRPQRVSSHQQRARTQHSGAQDAISAYQWAQELEQLFVVLRALSRFTGGLLGCCFSHVIFALTVLAEPARTLLGVGPFHNEKTLDQGFRAHTSIAQTDTLLVSISFDRPWLGR
jgi:hypothetical protein